MCMSDRAMIDIGKFCSPHDSNVHYGTTYMMFFAKKCHPLYRTLATLKPLSKEVILASRVVPCFDQRLVSRLSAFRRPDSEVHTVGFTRGVRRIGGLECAQHGISRKRPRTRSLVHGGPRIAIRRLSRNQES